VNHSQPHSLPALMPLLWGPFSVCLAAQLDVAVRCQTQFGENVVLVGSAPSLGGWDVSKALTLAWTDGHVWRGSVALEPGKVECKVSMTRGGLPGSAAKGPPGGGVVAAFAAAHWAASHRHRCPHTSVAIASRARDWDA
jgi:hypothetical protein